MVRIFVCTLFLLPAAAGSSREQGAHDHRLAPRVQILRPLKLQLLDSSLVAWAELYVDGAYRGRIWRGRAAGVKLVAGLEYDLAVRREWKSKIYARCRRIYLPPGEGSHWVFFAPRVQGNNKRGRLIVMLTNSSRLAWADLYLNGKKSGKIHRGQPRRFWLSTETNQEVRVLRIIGRHAYRAGRQVRLRDGGTRHLILSPQRLGYGKQSAYLRIGLDSKAVVAWASLYINGTFRSRLRRGHSVRFRVQAGTSHRIELSRRINSKRYYVERHILLHSGRIRMLWLHPKPH